MAELKTRQTEQSVEAFLAGIPDEQKRRDCQEIAALMQEVTGQPPSMWGESIVGYGRYPYVYASGRSGEWFLAGFSPRKQNITLYLMGGLEQQAERLARLGKHSTGKGCLYIKRLSDIDLPTLRAMLEQIVASQTSAD